MKRTTFKEIEQAAKLYAIERKHMSGIGWTLAAYIAKYGPEEKPLMGDGGPLIWEADLAALFRARDHFLNVLRSAIFQGCAWENRCPIASKIWKEYLLGLPAHIDTLHARRVAAGRLISLMQNSNT